jgi:hypothetical protein
MRDLLLNQKQFDIGREQLITSSRQVEQAEYAILRPEQGEPVTLNLLRALTSVLDARNGLISNWVSYESTRLSLYSNFDLMDIDANGIWTNENDPDTVAIALRLAAEDPAVSLAIPATIPDLSDESTYGRSLFIDGKPSDRPTPDERPGNEGPLNDRDLQSRPDETGDGGGLDQPAGPPPGPSPFAPPSSP